MNTAQLLLQQSKILELNEKHNKHVLQHTASCNYCTFTSH